MKKIIIICVLFVFWFPVVVSADSESEATASASINYSPTFEAGGDKRGAWPGSAHSVHPQMPGNFAGVPQTHEPLNIESFMKSFKYEWTTNEVRNFLREDDVKSVEVEARSVNRFNASNQLKIVFPQVRPRGKMVMEVGTIKGRSLKENTSSEAVLGMLIMEALQMGGNVIVPLNEGAGRVLGASGWAASIGYTHVVIGGSEGQAGVGGVGLGYAKGQSSYSHEPFARFAVLHVPSDMYQRLAIFPSQVAKAEPESKPAVQRGVDPMILERNKTLQKKLKIEEEKSRYYKYRYKNKK
jgi:hypothetical protein